VRRVVPLAVALFLLLSGCSTPAAWVQTITSVTPSSSGTPNSVATLGNYEFVSVQGTGQIFTYNIAGGSQLLAAPPYATPCKDPSGMVLTTIAGNNVMAVVCYDTSTLLTLTVHSDGSLSALGAASGLTMPYPGIALDGTNVLVPLFGQNLVANGAVAKVNIASPTQPVITGTATLASPVSGGFVNPGYLAVAGGYVFVAAGSENAPLGTSSTIQVVNESTMALLGTPLVVAHSPQQIALHGTVAYVTFFDTPQLESIDISTPANLHPLEVASLASSNSNCHAIPIIVRDNFAYIGCYSEGVIDQFDITNPSNMRLAQSIVGIDSPQRLDFAGNYLLVSGSESGGRVYQINTGAP
jgi:hypothetical protein